MFNRFALDKKQRVRRDELLAALRAIPVDADFDTAKPLIIEAFRGVGSLWTWFDEGPGCNAVGWDAFAKVRRLRNAPDHGGRELFAAINEKPARRKKAA